MRSVAVASLMLLGCASSVQTPSGSMKRPAGFGPSALAVVRLAPSTETAKDYYCPEPEGSDDICLGATMFFQGGWIRRVIAASQDFAGPRAGRFKTIGGHAAVAATGGNFIAILERTDAGYTWVPWQEPVRGNRVCVPQFVIERFTVVLPKAATLEKNGSRCLPI